jgi:hypothetical protein
MRKMLAIGATKFLIWLGQAMNKQGSSTPGKIGLKIYPNAYYNYRKHRKAD